MTIISVVSKIRKNEDEIIVKSNKGSSCLVTYRRIFSAYYTQKDYNKAMLRQRLDWNDSARYNNFQIQIYDSYYDCTSCIYLSIQQ